MTVTGMGLGICSCEHHFLSSEMGIGSYSVGLVIEQRNQSGNRADQQLGSLIQQ
jgi:hypothetical protein